MEIFFTQQVAEELAGAVKDEIQATYGCVVTLNFTRALTMSILTKNKSRGSLRPQNWKY